MHLTNSQDTLEEQYRQLIAALLPEGILDYFDLTQVQKDQKGLYLHLEEKNSLPKEFQEQTGVVYHSKGGLSPGNRSGLSHPGPKGAALGQTP